jgi:nucleoid-associated protein YgaU
LNDGIAFVANFLRQNGQSVQTNAERREAERKQAEAAAAAQQARDLEEAKAQEEQAAAERAKQEAERARVETEQKMALEKFRAEQAQKAAEAELQRKKEQSEIEFRDLVHKTFGFAFPILGCVLLGTIFFVAIRRRAKQETENEEAKKSG